MLRSDGCAVRAPVEPLGSGAPRSHPGSPFFSFISVGLARLWTLSSKFWLSRLSALEAQHFRSAAAAGGLDTSMAGSEV